MARRKRHCPRCGGRVAEIAYGMVPWSPEIEAGDVVVGGCDVSEGLPLWVCRECGHEWGRLRLASPFTDVARRRPAGRSRPILLSENGHPQVQPTWRDLGMTRPRTGALAGELYVGRRAFVRSYDTSRCATDPIADDGGRFYLDVTPLRVVDEAPEQPQAGDVLFYLGEVDKEVEPMLWRPSAVAVVQVAGASTWVVSVTDDKVRPEYLPLRSLPKDARQLVMSLATTGAAAAANKATRILALFGIAE